MSLHFILRHLRGHWRDNLVLWLGLLIIGALPAVLPAYTAPIAERSLDQRLNAAPTAARNLLIGGSGLNEELYAQVIETLGPLLSRRVEVRDLEIEGNSTLYTPDSRSSFEEFLALHLYAFTDLEGDVTVVEGRLPEPGGGNVIEAAVGAEVLTGPNFSVAADGGVTIANLSIGDELRASDGGRFRIVGVVTPNEPDSDAWWGTLLPFRFFRQARHGSNQPETVIVSLLVPPEEVHARYPGFAHQWRLLTDLSAVNVENAPTVQSAVRDIETRLSTNFLQIETSLPALIDGFFADAGRGRVALFLLAFQGFLLALLAFALVVAALLRRRRDEFITLADRGIGGRRIIALNAAGFLLLALSAVALAPLVGNVMLRLWDRGGGREDFAAPPAESWLLAGVGVIAGALVFMLVLIPIARGARRRQWPVALPPVRPFWQRYYLDVILLLVGGLLYRQTTASGGPITTAGTSIAGAADPLLLVGPTLALVGAALLIVRLYPLILRVMAKMARGPSLLGLHSLAHLGRAPADGGRVAFIVTLAAGLALFASLMEHSLAVRQEEIAHFVAGADVRAGVAIEADPATYAAAAGLDGVAAVAPAYRNTETRWAAETRREATLLAVEPAGFGDVGRFPPDAGSLTMAGILPALTSPTGDALPAVFSDEAYPQDKLVGDIVTYLIGSDRVDFEVRGIIREFPSLSGPFILTNLALLEERVNFAQLGEVNQGQREVWLGAEAGRAAEVTAAVERGEVPAGSVVLASAADERDTLAADMAGQQAVAALRLNVAAVTLISAAAVAVLLVLAARRRDSEFGVLRALGLSRGQWLSLLILEGATAVAVGLLAGTLIGYGLARMMLPVLSRLLSAAVGGNAIHRPAVDWPSLLGLYALFFAVYGLALLVLPLVLRAGAALPSRLSIESE